MFREHLWTLLHLTIFVCCAAFRNALEHPGGFPAVLGSTLGTRLSESTRPCPAIHRRIFNDLFSFNLRTAGQTQSLAAGVVGFINTYTCLYIHISVFLFLYRLIVAGRAAAALVKCFYIESFKFTAHETRDVYKKQHQLQLQFPHCSALCLLPRLFCIAHLAVAFQLTKLYFYFWSHIAADRSTSWRKLILLWPNGMARC